MTIITCDECNDTVFHSLDEKRFKPYPLIVLDLDNGQKYKAPKSWFLNVVVGSNKQ